MPLGSSPSQTAGLARKRDRMGQVRKEPQQTSSRDGIAGPSGAEAGMILMDLSLRPIAIDHGAVSLLNGSRQRGPNPEGAFAVPKALLDAIRRSPLPNTAPMKLRFYIGRNEYVGRTYLVEPCNGVSRGPLLAVHLERKAPVTEAVARFGAEYHLTGREQQALRGIALGLTSKELASRMSIRPNTVKAFLRLIMLKLNVTSKAGIAAKLLISSRDTHRKSGVDQVTVDLQ